MPALHDRTHAERLHTVAKERSPKRSHTAIKCSGDDLVLHVVTQQLQRSPAGGESSVFHLCARESCKVTKLLKSRKQMKQASGDVFALRRPQELSGYRATHTHTNHLQMSFSPSESHFNCITHAASRLN